MKTKRTLIIGGTRGIGRALVATLAEKKQLVSVIGRHPANEMDLINPNTRYWTVDLLDKKKLSRVLKEIISNNNPLNNLVFLQHYRGRGDDWRGEIETSLNATKYIIENLAGKFEKVGDKSIVIVSSVAGFSVADEQPLSYHVVKAGLNQMVRYYAFVLGSKGIRVNAVSSGTIIKEESKQFYSMNKQLSSLYAKIIPLGRMGTSFDVANVVVFLCSEQAAFITGQNIIVDGGVSLWWQESLARKLTSLKNIKVTR